MNSQVRFSDDSTGCGSIFAGDSGISRAQLPNLSIWDFGSSSIFELSVEDLFPVFKESIPDLVSLPLRKSYEHTRNGKIDWSLALGPKRFAASLKSCFRSLAASIERIEKDRYLSTIVSGREVLAALQPAMIDEVALRAIQSETSLSHSATFSPGPDGFADSIRYSHNTSTGRLTVSRGPRILSLPKGERKIIKSRWEGGQVFMIDFVSLEPRVMLLLTRDEAPMDIYEAMRIELDLPDATRAKLKLATISSLYGSKSNDPAMVASVNRFFRSSEVGRRHLSGEEVCNLYGRRLNPEEAILRLPHFIQSTAVDVALNGFSSLLKFLPSGCVPIFLIHDAILIDVPPESVGDFPSTFSLEIEPLGKFYLSSKPIQVDT